MHERYSLTDRRQTDIRQTDRQTADDSEHELEFTFANNSSSGGGGDDDDKSLVSVLALVLLSLWLRRHYDIVSCDTACSVELFSCCMHKSSPR